MYTTKMEAVKNPNMYVWQSEKIDLREGKKSKEYFYYTSKSSKKAIMLVVEVLSRGES